MRTVLKRILVYVVTGGYKNTIEVTREAEIYPHLGRDLTDSPTRFLHDGMVHSLRSIEIVQTKIDNSKVRITVSMMEVDSLIDALKKVRDWEGLNVERS